MRKSRAERGFSVALGLFALVLAAYLFLSSPFFRLEKMEIKGQTHFRETDVMVMAGLRFGQNLFDVDMRKTTQLLLTEPRLAKVDIRRKLPSGLVITLEERQGVAVVAGTEGLWRVDGEGRVLEEVKGPHGNLVVTAAVPPTTITPGEVLSDPALRAATSVAAALPLELAAQVSEIHATSVDKLELAMRNGINVQFGAWRDVPEKVRVLDSLLKQMRSAGAGARLVDVSVPTNPVVR